MKIFESNEELKNYIKNGIILIYDDVHCDFNIDVNASIVCQKLSCWDLTCGDLDCGDLKCRNLKCLDLKCLDLKCLDLDCGDLKCLDLKCLDLKCLDLDCGDLTCRNLTCLDLNYHAHAIAYHSFKCRSAKGKRENSFHKCLDSEIEYIKDKSHTITLDGKQIELSEESYQSFKKQFNAEGEA